MSTKPRISILATGGTIAGTAAQNTDLTGYTAAVLPVDDLIAQVPALWELAQVRGEQICQIGSENMTPDIWLKLSRRVDDILRQNDADGVVVTHGTDTIEETAYFLHLTVHSARPVVLVGAMRPATAISADGPINLYSAVLLATSPQAAGRGVMVCLNDAINGARDVAKTNTALADAFRSPELGYMGYIQDGQPFIYNQSTRRHTVDSEFLLDDIDALPPVDIVYGYAGANTALIDAAVAHGARGIVYAAPGNGSLSTDACAALQRARAAGVAVVRSSRVGSGRVAVHPEGVGGNHRQCDSIATRGWSHPMGAARPSNPGGEADDDTLGFVAGDNLSPQKARVLLMLGLTRTADSLELQRMFDIY